MVPSFLWIFTEAVLPSRKAAVTCSISSLVAAVFEARVAPCLRSSQPESVTLMW